MVQEGVPLLLCIYHENNECGNQCYGKKYFHAHRIAQSRKSMLYRELTNTQQKCNLLSDRDREEERASLPLNTLCPNLAAVRFDDMLGDG